MPAYTREEWNDIIKRINELAENPEGGCDELEPLEEVEPEHIWKKKDIEDARDKLMEICDENEFNEELKMWTQAIIDEIEAAIEEGWCNCDPCERPCSIDDFDIEVEIRVLEPEVYFQSQQEEYESIVSEIAGQVVASLPLHIGIYWTLATIIDGEDAQEAVHGPFVTCQTNRASMREMQVCIDESTFEYVQDIQVAVHNGVMVSDDTTPEGVALAQLLADTMGNMRVVLRGHICESFLDPGEDEDHTCEESESLYSDSQTESASLIVKINHRRQA